MDEGGPFVKLYNTIACKYCIIGIVKVYQCDEDIALSIALTMTINIH
jgi:hypothetical protein